MPAFLKNMILTGVLRAQLVGVALLLLLGSRGEAQSIVPTFSYQGRAFDTNGTSPLLRTVDIKLQIRSSNGACLLYEEQQSSLNLSTSNGYFSLNVGSVLGDAKRTGSDPGLSMPRIFSNTGQVRASGTDCIGGYTPASGDKRRLRITIVDGGVSTTLNPDQDITSVPYATVAETLQGVSASGFIQVSGAVTQSNLSDLLAKKTEILSLVANESALSALASGSSALYVKPSAGGVSLTGTGNISLSPQKSLQLGTYSTAQQSTFVGSLTAADRGKTWYNSDSNMIMYWDGTSSKALGSATAITSFNGSTQVSQSLAVGSSGTSPAWVTDAASGTHTLNLPQASTSGVTAGLVSNAEYAALATKAYSDANLAGKTLAAPTVAEDGQSLRWNNTSQAWEYFSVGTGSVQTTDPRLSPALAGDGSDALKMLRVNNAGTGYELRSPADVVSDLGLGTASTADASSFLTKSGNLSGLASAATARSNLGFTATGDALATAASAAAARGSLGVTGTGDALFTAADAATARTALSLGGAAVLDVGVGSGKVAAGDDARITGALQQTTFNTYVAGASGVNACASGETMYWNSVSSQFDCATLGLAASQITSGTIDVARLPLATGASAGAVVVGTGLGVSSGTISVAYGNGAGTAIEGNNSRLNPAPAGDASDATQMVRMNAAGTGYELRSPAQVVSDLGLGTAATADASTLLTKSGNLSGLASAATARTNLGITSTGDSLVTAASAAAARGSLGVTATGDAIATAASASAARTTLGLGGAATLNVGTASGTVAAGDDARITGALSQSTFNGYVSPVSGASACTSSQMMYWNSVSGTFACASISLPASRISGGTVGGALTVPADFNVQAADGSTEGGQINLLGAGSYNGSTLDNASGTFRIFGKDTVGVTLAYSPSLGTLSIGNSVSFSGQQDAGNAGLEMGLSGVSSTPYLDFHSSSTATDYDVRFLTSGGTAASGNGNLRIEAAAVETTGSLKVGNSTATCDASIAGTIRWSGSAFEGCDGSSWVSLSGGAGAAADPGKMVFSTTGTSQFVVPAGVTSLTVKAWGAGGYGSTVSSGTNYSGGGSGGYAEGTFSVTPGDVIGVVVGQGAANDKTSSGYSGVFIGNTPSQANAIIIAGAGGNGGSSGADGETSGGGGGGGGLSGQNGVTTHSGGGGGGTQSAGGAGGADGGGAGSALAGGTGNGKGHNGGSGYWGGGGSGGVAFGSAGGGGGGSGYLRNTVTGSMLSGTTGGSGGSVGVVNPPKTTDPDYAAGVGQGKNPGGDGLVVISW